jgi:hypothetical protein
MGGAVLPRAEVNKLILTRCASGAQWLNYPKVRLRPAWVFYFREIIAFLISRGA